MLFRSGVLVIAWMTLSQTPLWPASLASFKSGIHGFMTVVVGTAVILLAGLLFGETKRAK